MPVFQPNVFQNTVFQVGGPGFRSPLAFWVGGAAAAHVVVQGGVRSPFMFLLGLGGSSAVARVIDTHDGVRKKKKKKKQIDFAEEIDRRERLRKQIEEVIHPQVIEVIPVEEEKEPETAKKIPTVELKSFPITDYAGLAKDQIVAKVKSDALIKARKEQEEFQRQLELKRLEDEEEERELLMILDAIL